jgi:hypothetical protein
MNLSCRSVACVFRLKIEAKPLETAKIFFAGRCPAPQGETKGRHMVFTTGSFLVHFFGARLYDLAAECCQC